MCKKVQEPLFIEAQGEKLPLFMLKIKGHSTKFCKLGGRKDQQKEILGY